MDCSWACLPAWIAGGKAKRFGTSGSGTESVAPLSEVFPSFAAGFLSQGSWEEVVSAALHRQTRISVKPRPGTEVVDNRRCEGGRVGSVGQASRREFPKGRARSMRSAGRDELRQIPSREKRAPTLHMHTPAESVPCALRHRALLGTHGVSRHAHTTHSTARAVPHAACVCLCSLRRCGLVSACE